MDFPQVALVVVVAVVMGWFALGVISNIRRGNQLLKWMQTGLPQMGERTTVRWLGSSAVELNIAKAKAPFRRIELVMALEPRDVPWFWVLAHWQGRRDLLIVRGQLAAVPRLEFDLLAPGSWSERLAHPAAVEWASEPVESMRFRGPAAARSLARQTAAAALAAARRARPDVWRLSARREYPQFELHLSLPDARQTEAAQFFAAVRATAEQLTRPPAE